MASRPLVDKPHLPALGMAASLFAFIYLALVLAIRWGISDPSPEGGYDSKALQTAAFFLQRRSIWRTNGVHHAVLFFVSLSIVDAPSHSSAK
jgi:hypothetical protein